MKGELRIMITGGMNMTLEENALKEKLTRIKENGYLTEKEDSCMDLGLKMLDNIGSTDPELRDKLIYDIFFSLDYERKVCCRTT